MTSVLSLNDISLQRGETQILSHVNLNVVEGQHWVILGANGAGKTTLARIAAACLFPSAGTAEILQEQLGKVDINELRSRIGFTSAALAQQVSPSETVLSVVLSAGYGRIGVWREQYETLDVARAGALLDALGVQALQQRQWGSLSSGERKRVEIARALMPDPELLILDEPASGLDVAGRELLLAALNEIISAPGSPTILLVTHHLEEIPVGFTHALALRAGAVQGSGKLAEVLTADIMSTTFNLPLEITYDRGRWAARGKLNNSNHGAHAN